MISLPKIEKIIIIRIKNIPMNLLINAHPNTSFINADKIPIYIYISILIYRARCQFCVVRSRIIDSKEVVQNFDHLMGT